MDVDILNKVITVVKPCAICKICNENVSRHTGNHPTLPRKQMFCVGRSKGEMIWEVLFDCE
jgi:hypothetical protein